ncbi:SpoIIE family protein phosphatase [Nocardioides sp. MAHUQ-72]|uniref:SpoIIE family protein phosphatase n=1 Tax=unclassified Nocardioides TaxID=2615069 RepID=UPI00360D6F60
MTSFPVRAQQSFAADASCVADARRFTRRTLEEWGEDELADTAALIVSELVTNAVVHTGTTARLTLGLRGRNLRIDVEDQHPGHQLPVVPGRPPDTSEHGRGLVITTSLSTAWGVEYTRTGKRVWVVCGHESGAVGGDGVVAAPGPAQRTHVAVVELSGSGVVTAWNDDATALLGWRSDDVVGRRYADLLDGVDGSSPPEDLDAPDGDRVWRGSYAVACRDGSSATVFASHAPAADRTGTIVLMVAEAQRALLEHPASSPAPAGAGHPTAASFGLRPDALVRLGVEDYLSLAAERVRDPVGADATYVLLAHDFDDELEVVAVSGLPEQLLGTRLPRGAAGTPDTHSTALPVVVPDLAEHDVALLAGTGLRSLVVVPLTVEGKVVGALGAASAVARGFDDVASARLQQFADSIALTADRGRLQASERERRGWLSFIAEAGDLLAGSLDQDMTMAITGQVVVPRVGRWCAIHLADERGKLVLQQVWHEDETQADELRSALEATPGDELAGGTATVVGYSLTSIPLVARGKRIGLLTVGRSRGDRLRGELLLVAESVARRAALAIDNARAHGALQAAGRALQESLLPPSVPTVPGLDVGVVYEAAGQDAAAGGDFYDLFPAGNGSWCFVVGDVCGTGAQAAAVTGLARHTIQALVRAGLPPAATLERLNTAILEEGARSRFMTLVCGVLRPEGVQVRLELVNAGHPPPYLVSGDGSVGEIGAPQTLLGVVDHVAYVAETHTLHRGDLLVTVTDGVLERRDGERMLGEDGFPDELAAAAHLPAQAVADRVRRLVAEFSDEPQHDDLAVLAIRVRPQVPAGDPDR